MTRVRWTPQARADLREIHKYISRDSAQYADLVIADLLASVRRLHDFPLSGRVVPSAASQCCAKSSGTTIAWCTAISKPPTKCTSSWCSAPNDSSPWAGHNEELVQHHPKR